MWLLCSVHNELALVHAALFDAYVAARRLVPCGFPCSRYCHARAENVPNPITLPPRTVNDDNAADLRPLHCSHADEPMAFVILILRRAALRLTRNSPAVFVVDWKHLS